MGISLSNGSPHRKRCWASGSPQPDQSANQTPTHPVFEPCANKFLKQQNGYQLSADEMTMIDRIMRKDKGTATDALQCINVERSKRNIRQVEKSTVHRYARGRTHKRDAAETRGRKRALSKQSVRKLDQARRRLIKRADNQQRVTYAAVIKEAGLKDVVCQRVCEDALRQEGVAYRHPRRKIYVSEDDAKKRLEVAKKWIKRPSSYWANNVHAYVDNKAFPIPLTPKQRTRLRQTMITGHLRKPKEGIDRGFTKPREKHSFIGIPSVTISAAVAKDKVIMWHVVPTRWNGAAAATMYEDHLKPALVRSWGERARYTIIEDGDRKGNMSHKGKAAKVRAKIDSTMLPPRTPSLMPLDYSIWQTIVNKMMAGAPKNVETKAHFLKRLENLAKKLPKGYVKTVIGRMRGNVQALIDARGFTPKND